MSSPDHPGPSAASSEAVVYQTIPPSSKSLSFDQIGLLKCSARASNPTSSGSLPDPLARFRDRLPAAAAVTGSAAAPIRGRRSRPALPLSTAESRTSASATSHIPFFSPRFEIRLDLGLSRSGALDSLSDSPAELIEELAFQLDRKSALRRRKQDARYTAASRNEDRFLGPAQPSGPIPQLPNRADFHMVIIAESAHTQHMRTSWNQATRN